MTRWRLTIEYDGTPFMGWQRQDHGPSVQQALEEAAERMTGEKAVFIAARQKPRARSSIRVRMSAVRKVRQGRVTGMKINAAEAMRNQATPNTPTAGKSSTAKDGPR